MRGRSEEEPRGWGGRQAGREGGRSGREGERARERRGGRGERGHGGRMGRRTGQVYDLGERFVFCGLLATKTKSPAPPSDDSL